MVGDKLLMLLFILILSSISFGAVIEDQWDVGRDDNEEPNDDVDEDAGEEMEDLRSDSQFDNFREDDDDSDSREEMVNVPAQDHIEDEQVDNDDEEDDDVMNDEEDDDLQDYAKPYRSEDGDRTLNQLNQNNNFEDFKTKVEEIRKTNEDMQAQINRLHTDFDSVLGHSEDLREHPEEAKNDVRQDVSGLDHSDDNVSNENKNKGNWQDTVMPQRSVHEDELARAYSQIGEDDYAPDPDSDY